METIIKDFNRSAFKGLRFEFVCDGKYLTIQENPEKAIEWFKSFTGQEPLEVRQVSKYPARKAY